MTTSLQPPAPVRRISVEDDHEFVFIVKLKTFGKGDRQQLEQVSAFLGSHLHNAFGIDRVELWHEGARVFFDPLALDGEHVGHDETITIREER